MTTPPEVGARSLRRQMRVWRRQRADTTLHEQVSEAYIWVFSIVVIGAMGISAMIQTRVTIAAGCTTVTCDEARTSLVWAVAVGVVALALTVAQAIGPVMVTPATGAWLLTTPIDRRPLLRSRLVVTSIVTALACGAAASVAGLLAGFPVGAIAVLGVAVALGGAVVTAVAASWQGVDHAPTRRAAAVLAAVTATWMLLIALDREPTTHPGWTTGAAGWTVLGVGLVATGVLVTRATRSLHRLRRSDLVPGGSLLSSLSGALAGLDLTLAYDVLVARRWRTRATVRPVLGGPGGAGALVWRDLVRLRRSPGAVTALAAGLLVPYVFVRLGLDDMIVLASALTAFVAGIWLCSALRTTARNPGLMRCFPQSPATVRSATLVVPGLVIVAWSLAAIPAIAKALTGTSTAETIGVAIATGVAAVGAVARWLLAGPPDYSQPLVSSPAGAVPIGLIGSTLRGLDVLLLLTVPLLVAPDAVGALVSLGLAASVLGYLVSRP